MATSLSFGKKLQVSEIPYWLTRMKPTTLAGIVADMGGHGYIAGEAKRMLVNNVGQDEADEMIEAAKHL